MEQATKQYPAGSMVRVRQIVGRGGEPGLLPIAESTWWKWVKRGSVPAGVKIGQRTTAWPIETVLAIARGEQPK